MSFIVLVMSTFSEAVFDRNAGVFLGRQYSVYGIFIRSFPVSALSRITIDCKNTSHPRGKDVYFCSLYFCINNKVSPFMSYELNLNSDQKNYHQEMISQVQAVIDESQSVKGEAVNVDRRLKQLESKERWYYPHLREVAPHSHRIYNYNLATMFGLPGLLFVLSFFPYTEMVQSVYQLADYEAVLDNIPFFVAIFIFSVSSVFFGVDDYLRTIQCSVSQCGKWRDQQAIIWHYLVFHREKENLGCR